MKREMLHVVTLSNYTLAYFMLDMRWLSAHMYRNFLASTQTIDFSDASAFSFSVSGHTPELRPVVRERV